MTLVLCKLATSTYEICLRLFVSDEATYCPDAFCYIIPGITMIVRSDMKNDYLIQMGWSIMTINVMYLNNFRYCNDLGICICQNTFGANPSSSPSSSLQSNVSVLSPAIPKLQLCIWQKLSGRWRKY